MQKWVLSNVAVLRLNDTNKLCSKAIIFAFSNEYVKSHFSIFVVVYGQKTSSCSKNYIGMIALLAYGIGVSA